MIRLTRRDVLAGTAAMGASSVFNVAKAANPDSKFRFVHMTDLHIQPELGATDGVMLAIKKIAALNPRPDFVLLGGDHFMDMLSVTHERANVQAVLLTEALRNLEMPVHSAVGNHDVYGWSATSTVTAGDPAYGKKLLAERFIKAPTYRSFDHLGWHFIVLDSIQPNGRDWTSGIDDTQLTWLKNDLEKAGTTPTVVMTHMPMLSIFGQYVNGTQGAPSPQLMLANGKEVFELLKGRNVKAVLQGHTHVVENCEYLGTEYITGGAVCGEWWKGPRLGVHPEGFMVYDVDGDKLIHQYVASGWKAKA